MRLSWTFSLYVTRQFLLSILLVMATLSVLIFFIDFLEILRRASSKELSSGAGLLLAFLKFPLMAQKVTPFAIFVAAVLTIARLTRSNELVVARAAGVSVWQFLLPMLLTGVALGFIMISIINPISCLMIGRYEQLESKYLEGQISSLAVSESGLWFRQRNDASHAADFSSDDDMLKTSPTNPAVIKGESIVHADRAGNNDTELIGVIIFMFRNKDEFIRRIDAKRAVLGNEFWHLQNVVITEPNKAAISQEEYFLETELTLQDIQNSLASPETISFWKLPGFIKTLEEAGFSSRRHQLYFYALLVSPFFYFTMILVAAMFSLRMPQRGKISLLISSSILVGFLIYFLTDLIAALGLAGNLPLMLAAVAPAAIAALAGATMLLHLEDG